MKNQKNKKTGKTFIGKVIGNKMTDTLVISMSYTQRHPIYKKILTKHKKIYSDNFVSANLGDTVKVRETRPTSKLKRFTAVEIIKKAL